MKHTLPKFLILLAIQLIAQDHVFASVIDATIENARARYFSNFTDSPKSSEEILLSENAEANISDNDISIVTNDRKHHNRPSSSHHKTRKALYKSGRGKSKTFKKKKKMTRLDRCVRWK